jgi:hypothetical protein
MQPFYLNERKDKSCAAWDLCVLNNIMEAMWVGYQTLLLCANPLHHFADSLLAQNRGYREYFSSCSLSILPSPSDVGMVLQHEEGQCRFDSYPLLHHIAHAHKAACEAIETEILPEAGR